MFDLADNRAARMLAHGRVTVTFKSPSGNHITVLAKAKAPNPDGKWEQVPLADAKIIWLEVPNSDGWNDRIGKVTGSKGFVPAQGADPARIYCAKTLIALVRGHAVDGRLEIKVEDRCAICGKQLTDPISIDRGIGPDCLGKATGSIHQKKSKSDGKDKKGVSYGHGDWKARKDELEDHLRADKPKREKTDIDSPAMNNLNGVCNECGKESDNIMFGWCGSCDAQYHQGIAEVQEIQAISAPGSALREQLYLEMELAAYNRGE